MLENAHAGGPIDQIIEHGDWRGHEHPDKGDHDAGMMMVRGSRGRSNGAGGVFVRFDGPREKSSGAQNKSVDEIAKYTV